MFKRRGGAAPAAHVVLLICLLSSVHCSGDHPTTPSCYPGGCIDYGDYLHWAGGVNTPGAAHGVTVSGTHAYVAGYESGLQVIDITNPQSPLIVGSADTPGVAHCVAIAGNRVYVGGTEGTQVLPAQCGL